MAKWQIQWMILQTNVAIHSHTHIHIRIAQSVSTTVRLRCIEVCNYALKNVTVETWLGTAHKMTKYTAFHHFINSNDIDRQCWFNQRIASSVFFLSLACRFSLLNGRQCHLCTLSNSNKTTFALARNICKCSHENRNIQEIYHHIRTSIPL